MPKRRVALREFEETPYVVWNAYINLLAREAFQDLDPVQRPAHLVFWYESEVQNGGHLQYFENCGVERLAETVEGLGVLGAACQQRILKEAGELWLSHPRQRIETVEEYCETAIKGEFDKFDSRFGKCSPSLQECLESYLSRNQASFVILE